MCVSQVLYDRRGHQFLNKFVLQPLLQLRRSSWKRQAVLLSKENGNLILFSLPCLGAIVVTTLQYIREFMFLVPGITYRINVPRDDDDINDVASMAGVNLSEESANILATNSGLVGVVTHSCKDEAFLSYSVLHRRMLEIGETLKILMTT